MYNCFSKISIVFDKKIKFEYIAQIVESKTVTSE